MEKLAKFLKRTILVLGLVALALAVLGPGYWAKQARYLVAPDSLILTAAGGRTELGPDMLLIEKVGIKTPIIYVEDRSEAVFQEALEYGVAHYPETAEIGERGNAYIFGHSSRAPWRNDDYDTIFSLLPKLEPGDTIVATNHAGHRFTYEVVRTMVVSPDETGLLEQGDGFELTLQTSYPLGTRFKRFIVV